MTNLQPSLSFAGALAACTSPICGGTAGLQEGNDRKMASAEQLVLDICNPKLRENALLQLAKMREICQDLLAPLLWHSFGTIAALLQRFRPSNA